MVEDHPHCVVRSYLEWLKDSDVRKVCVYCGESVGQDADTAFRLTCYEFAHEKCFAKYIQSLPRQTAPAGFTCKACKTPVFALGEASPVAVELRKTLANKGLIPPTVAWVLEGSGMAVRCKKVDDHSPKIMEGEELAMDSTEEVTNKFMPQKHIPVEGLGGWDMLNDDEEEDVANVMTSTSESTFDPTLPSSSQAPIFSVNRQALVDTILDDDSVKLKIGKEKLRAMLSFLNGTTPSDRRRRRRIGAGAIVLIGGCYMYMS